MSGIDSLSDNALMQISKAEIGNLIRDKGGDNLAGFALCTDDDLTTLFAAMASKEWMNDLQNEDLYFWPPDWPTTGFADSLGETAKCLRARRLGESGTGVIDRSFECLVAVLQQLRAEGVLGNRVGIQITSTDPSEHLEQLASAAVRRLNSAEFYSRWKRVWMPENR